MNKRNVIVVLAAVALSMTSAYGFAQGKGGRSGAARQQQVNPPRSYDRDRQQDRQQNRQEDRNGAARDRDRDRDRLHVEDPSGQQIYGSELMTEQERNQYRQRLQAAASAEQQAQVRAEHRQQMLERANQQGLDLVPPGQGPVYGGALMTVQERNEYRERLRLMEPGQEKEAFMAKHREEMRTRAAEQGTQLEEAEEAE